MDVLRFRAKPIRLYEMDGDAVAQVVVTVPKIRAGHFVGDPRRSHRFGGFGSMLESALARAAAEVGVKPGASLDLAALPGSVTVDASGYLVVVTVTL